jgi:DNA-binding response OmpR family regulator
MVMDLKALTERFADPNGMNEAEEEPVARPKAAAAVVPTRSFMFVESKVALQNLMRERLKTSGYRVLVTQDPDRAFARFKEDIKTADCIVFSTGGLGEPALDAYNRFADDADTQQVPAILLLDDDHLDWKPSARQNKNHVVLTMPIKIREFREALARLAPLPSSETSGAK